MKRGLGYVYMHEQPTKEFGVHLYVSQWFIILLVCWTDPIPARPVQVQKHRLTRYHKLVTWFCYNIGP